MKAKAYAKLSSLLTESVQSAGAKLGRVCQLSTDRQQLFSDVGGRLHQAGFVLLQSKFENIT